MWRLEKRKEKSNAILLSQHGGQPPGHTQPYDWKAGLAKSETYHVRKCSWERDAKKKRRLGFSE